MRIVDTKGQICPAPLIATKRALRETTAGESFIILTDNPTAFNNICQFLKDNKADFRVSESEGAWTLTITRPGRGAAENNPEEYYSSSVAHFQKGNFIIVITSDKMGEGDAELGLLLMANFIKAIRDLDELPQKIVFYNKGVTIVTESSPVIEHLRDLEKMGVHILLCATCVNHYAIADTVGAGTLSNLYTIAQEMASAANIVRP